MGLNIDESLVLVIDVQEKLLNAVFNKESLVKKAGIIAGASNILGIPAVVTEQYPKGLGETVLQLKEQLGTNAKFYEKTAFSALENAEILEGIESYNRKQILVFGIETHICVNQTVEALIREGYEVYVIKDACGSRAESEYEAGLERMKDHGAYIVTTEIALFEWLKSSKHPHFKEVQALIK